MEPIRFEYVTDKTKGGLVGGMSRAMRLAKLAKL